MPSDPALLSHGRRLKPCAQRNDEAHNTVFVITIALMTVAVPVTALTPGLRAMRPVARRHILMADDMQPNRELIQRILKATSPTVTEVENGSQAISQCGAQKFHLIFMASETPALDGVMATRRLRLNVSTTPQHPKSLLQNTLSNAMTRSRSIGPCTRHGFAVAPGIGNRAHRASVVRRHRQTVDAANGFQHQIILWRSYSLL